MAVTFFDKTGGTKIERIDFEYVNGRVRMHVGNYSREFGSIDDAVKTAVEGRDCNGDWFDPFGKIFVADEEQADRFLIDAAKTIECNYYEDRVYLGSIDACVIFDIAADITKHNDHVEYVVKDEFNNVVIKGTSKTAASACYEIRQAMNDSHMLSFLRINVH